MSERPATYYFPTLIRVGDWERLCTSGDVRDWLTARGIDFTRCRIQFDGNQYSAELQGSEQHERTENFYG